MLMHCKSREIRQKGKTLKLVFSYCKRFYLQEEFQYQVGAANVTQGAIRRVLPPSSSPGIHNGSPRVSPYVYLYPIFTAPNHLTSPVSFAFVCTNIFVVSFILPMCVVDLIETTIAIQLISLTPCPVGLDNA